MSPLALDRSSTGRTETETRNAIHNEGILLSRRPAGTGRMTRDGQHLLGEGYSGNYPLLQVLFLAAEYLSVRGDVFMLTILTFAGGLIAGSFLNTCIYRLPRGESVLVPPSYCPQCRHRLHPLDLIPLVGFLLLKGKCRYCRQPISRRYPLVELLMGLLTVALYYHREPGTLLSALVATGVVIVAACTDLEHGIIPDGLVFPTLFAGVVYSFFSPLTSPGSSIAGLFLGGGSLLVIAFLSGGGMGGGDIKLMAALGAWLGWRLLLMVLFFSFLLGGIGGIWLLLLKIKERRDSVAFAPYIAVAVFLTLLGEKFICKYSWLFC